MRLLAVPASRLSSVRRAGLGQLCQHFEVTHATPCRGQKRASNSTHKGGRGKRAKPNPIEADDGLPLLPAPRNPMQRFLNITQVTLLLPKQMESFIRVNGPDAAAFLEDFETLGDELLEAVDIADALVRRYEYTVVLQNRQKKDRYRSLFSMLMFFDIVQCLWPQASGRLGEVMKDQLTETLGEVAKNGEYQVSVMRDGMNEWSLIGSKLDGLCSMFGPGCLFLLGEHLSDDL